LECLEDLFCFFGGEASAAHGATFLDGEGECGEQCGE
jgi:hypothetical protein